MEEFFYMKYSIHSFNSRIVVHVKLNWHVQCKSSYWPVQADFGISLHWKLREKTAAHGIIFIRAASYCV